MDSRTYAVCDTIRTAVGNEMVSAEMRGGYRRRYSARLVYGGLSVSVIHVHYREFGGKEGTMARSAFNQNVEYDLAESRQIPFRSLTLEVLEATNESIAFTVLRDRLEGWLGVEDAEKLRMDHEAEAHCANLVKSWHRILLSLEIEISTASTGGCNNN